MAHDLLCKSTVPVRPHKLAVLPVLCTLSVALIGASGCNNHPIKSVYYESEQVCTEAVDVPIVRPEVVLVVDRSGSMSDNPLGDETRWEALHGVISEVVSGQEASLQLGLTMFPAADAGTTWEQGACLAPTQLDVAVGADTGAAILGALPGPNAITQGGTPAAAAVQLAADHLRARDTQDPKLLVLVTDGAANCAADSADWQASLVYDEALQDAVANASMDGITTHVVGIQIDTELDAQAGVVPAEQLHEVAQLGGAGLDGEYAFYQVEDQAMLSAALSSITADISCTLEFGETVDTGREALVVVGDEPVEQATDCATEDGWVYTADDTGIQLCGAACERFQAQGEIVFEYLCE
ncbi:hypothetical protein PPSIR1_06648 [Plesiocystis pacifica SIR-1]|uniref:VWFA domain-containing protein n=1 Tax=Plesiocystis pacifica SIR-1 TaxID=391625 RepID=A6GKM5_9BACT|nr:hypothetical protein PPSIR1_06648 [Plesiocystis pacifica SIR-1]